MSEPQIDIRPDHWAIVRDILQRHVPQYAVWVFGSRAKWTAKEFSDLDLAIIADSPLPLATSAALAEDFSESDLPWKVDIVDWAETNETFRKVIERDRVVVQEANSLLTQPLNTICSLIVDCPHSTPAWTDSGFIVLRNQNIKNGKLDLSSPSFTDEGHFLGRNRRAKPSAGDIVITREAPMGEVCMIPNGLECCLGQRQVLLRPDPKIANSRYVLYALQSESVQHQIGWNEGTGSTVSNLRIPVLEALQIPMRPLKEQRAIAHILGTLDERIELNRRMNETLETMTRSLFKSWFVDFDGVPTEDFQESELGLIPKGWRVERLSSILEIIGGGTPKTSVVKYWDGDIPWFSVVDSPAASDVFVITTEKCISQLGLEESSARLISKGTTIISARGTVGNLAMAARDMTFNQSCYGLKGKQGIGDYFVFLTAQRMVDQLRSMAHGSVFSTITRQTFDAIRIAIPPVALFEKFEKDVSVWFDKILSNVQQTQELIQLRDTLLPKLISGEVRVKGAEKLMESIV